VLKFIIFFSLTGKESGIGTWFLTGCQKFKEPVSHFFLINSNTSNKTVLNEVATKLLF
jgi:hypothetical protein